jgi:trehalose 6-phosphate synthase/phosphatase
LNWLNSGRHDFILAVGDDSTDEDLFKSMPPAALTVRVGISATLAQYTVSNSAEVIDLLDFLSREARNKGIAESAEPSRRERS